MTALKKYQRLEATGLWRESPGARLREVIVGMRDATLVFSDPKTEMPLTQWSLPAIIRLDQGQMPAHFAPGEDSGEELELDDAEMIAALATVHRVLIRRKPHPGRLRTLVLGATALAVVGVVVFWLPEKIKSHAASVLPAPTRTQLGEMALEDLARLTGSPCKSVPGRRAAAELAARLFPGQTPRIEVLRDALPNPRHLPGNILLLPARLVEGSDGPDVIAGHLIAEALQATASDPVDPVLGHLGLGGTLRLLTTGSVSQGALQGYGEELLATEPGPLPELADLIDAFRAAGVSSTAFGQAIRADNSLGQGLIDKDPFAQGAPLPVMTDEDWLELQAICSE